MLFNSHEFLFAFLPLTLLGFFLLGARSRQLALLWVIAASLVFYAWWRPINVLIIAPSIAINYLLARALIRLTAAGEQRAGAARLVLALGIVFNVCFLGYFKYVNFLATVTHDLTGADFVLTEVVLPLGISFITFQKIAFLVDVYGKRVQVFSLRSYALFVLFFPQLIAGPIVHYREMMPQFERAPCRFDSESLAVGITLFVFGLFKKVVLADGIAVHVTPLFDAAASGTQTSLLAGWIAALGFTLQIYFDFSGYSDMALGLARCFGVRLPPNFDSPLKATSIIDFWQRWHITLTRFLTAYLYNPLVLWLARRRVAAGKSAVVGRSTTVDAFLALQVGPTMVTMFVSGLWHGAGYLFVLWGLLHGLYLSINHAWRIFGARLRKGEGKPSAKRWWPGFLLTFFAVVVAMVLFRSTNIAAAKSILLGMTGLHGIGLPPVIFDALGSTAGRLHGLVFASREISATDLAVASGWVAALLGIALLLPNTLQLLERFGPALVAPRAPDFASMVRVRAWSPSLPWAIVLSVLIIVSVFRLGGQSEFLYWQF